MLNSYLFMKQKLILLQKYVPRKVIFTDQGCISQKQLWSQVLSLQIEFNGNNGHS